MKTVSIHGTMTIGDGAGCGCSSDQTTKPLGLGPAGSMSGGCCTGGMTYDEAATFSTSIATIGAVGAAFVDLPALNAFTAIEFLRLVSSARVRLRINPTRPQMTGVSPIPPTGVLGAATLTVTDSVGTQYTATITFNFLTDTPATVAGAINAGLAAAGAPFPPDGQIARLSGTGAIVLVNPGIGPAAFLELAAGAPADLGLGVALVRVQGTASDLPDTEGLVILQFPRAPNAPTKIQVSGTATLDIVAAGRVTA